MPWLKRHGRNVLNRHLLLFWNKTAHWDCSFSLSYIASPNNLLCCIHCFPTAWTHIWASCFLGKLGGVGVICGAMRSLPAIRRERGGGKAFHMELRKKNQCISFLVLICHLSFKYRTWRGLVCFIISCGKSNIHKILVFVLIIEFFVIYLNVSAVKERSCFSHTSGLIPRPSPVSILSVPAPPP